MSSSPARHSYHLPMPYKHHSAYAPSTRASDISRLLDPSYCTPSRVATSPDYAPHQSTVYVDHSGDFHDPDYRDFPILNLSKKHRWEHNSSDRDHIIEEDENLNLNDFRSPRFPAYTSSTPRRSTSRPRSPAFTSSTASPSTSAYSAHPFSSSSPFTSFEEDDGVLSGDTSPFESDVELEKRASRRCSMRSLPSRRRKSDSSFTRLPLQVASTARLNNVASAISSSPFPSSVHVPIVEDEGNSKERVPIVDEQDSQDLTPTCSMAIRRQWQAIRLRLGLGVFRAKRRIRRKVGI